MSFWNLWLLNKFLISRFNWSILKITLFELFFKFCKTIKFTLAHHCDLNVTFSKNQLDIYLLLLSDNHSDSFIYEVKNSCFHLFFNAIRYQSVILFVYFKHWINSFLIQLIIMFWFVQSEVIMQSSLIYFILQESCHIVLISNYSQSKIV